ncbi:MAG TPA: hypothetical protein VIF15_01405 [Polyangiaceae bacterium]|jgi:hypothetical protein
MRAIIVLASAIASFALVACDNTNHPEYHPVTVTSYEQRVNYGATAQQGGAPPAGPVLSAPPPPQPPTPAPWSAWPDQ